jgi:gluconate:H+ symporter, GntP family
MFLVLLLLLSVVGLVLATNRLKLHPFLALLLVAIGYGMASGMPPAGVVGSINEGFGSTLGRIGILIVAGTIIGTFLEQSGGAYAMAEKILALVGIRRVPLAMNLIGWVVAIPVFADSGFVILSSLNRALSKRAKISLAAPAIALSLGLIAAHTLVPPTPGPIAAAGILGADPGLVILIGLPVSLTAALTGWMWASWMGRRFPIDPNPDLTDQQVAEKLSQAPATVKSALPIIAPLVLIMLRSVSLFPTNPLGSGALTQILRFLGDPTIALLLGVLLAFLLPRSFDLEMLSANGWIGKAVMGAAGIILITGAGGAFGKVLQDSGIATTLGEALSPLNLGIWLPFLLSAAIKTAQGSSTVAIITTSSLFVPLLEPLGFVTPVAVALVVLMIGAGSMVISHVNDSIFWVVTQMSSMSVSTGYRLHTMGTLIMGAATGILIWLMDLFVR